MFLNAVSKHKGTNPTFKKVAMIMKLLTSVEAQFFHMEEDLDAFLRCDREYGHDEDFRADLTDLGKTTGEVVDLALSESKEFLGHLSDVGGVFRRSKTSCFRLAGGILDFVSGNGGAAVGPAWVRELERLREALVSQASSMKSSWDRLIWCAIDNEDTTVFHEISDIVWTAEKAADKALFALEDSYSPYGTRTAVRVTQVMETDVGVGTGACSEPMRRGIPSG
jgi:hypothetical protein